MRTAIVHDYLSQRGGAERVVLALGRLYPEAPIYTSFYVPELTYPEFGEHEIRTSALQGAVDPNRFRRAVLRFPRAFASLDLSDYDQVIVSSSAFAHQVRHPHALVYCHTPPHFLYDTSAYLGSRALATLMWGPLEVLRHRDRSAASVACSYVANSHQTARRVAEVYGRTADVVYPPLWTAHLPQEPSELPTVPRALVIARLLPYKRVDVAIRACARAGVALTVVGQGPEEQRLRRMAGDDVQFLGRLNDDCMPELFDDHSVVLAPGLEDFGYGPVEANFAGRPVVALAAGGALETVRHGENGFLVEGWGDGLWASTIQHALGHTWSPTDLRASTERFQFDAFEHQLRSWVDGTWQ